MLHEFITTHRTQIIHRCRERVAARPHSRHTEAQIDYGVPLFLDQLVTTLRAPGDASLEIGASAALHGQPTCTPMVRERRTAANTRCFGATAFTV